MADTISSLASGIVQAMSTKNDNKIEAAKEAVVNVVKETVVKEVIHDTLNVDVSGLATKEEVAAATYDDAEVKALINEKAFANDVYTKENIDNQLATKANASDVFTKEEINNKLDVKANANDVFAKADTLSKESIENALSEKANASDIPDVSGFATREELYNDAEIRAALINKADSENVYTKAEVISLLEAKANLEDVYKKVDTYSAERIQELLDLEANKDSVYTIDQVNNLLAEKANSSDIPDVNDFVTKDSFTAISNTTENIKNFIGVSELDNIDVEMFAVDKTSNKGTRLQMSKVDGIYYTKNSMPSSSLSRDREIAVKADIPDVSNFVTADAIPDISGLAVKDNVDVELAKKADKTNLINSSGCIYNKYVNSSNGHSLLFNENDGGGSQVLDKTTNVQSYVGTNLDEGNSNSTTAVNVQIYSVDATSKDGVRINVNKNKAYYLAGTRAMTDDKEIAVKGDIPDVSALIARIETLEAKVAALEAKE